MQKPDTSSGQFTAKLEKGIEQRLSTIKQPQLIIDKAKAMAELDDIIKKIPKDWLDKKLSEIKPEYEKNKKMIEPFIVEFIKRSVRIE